jgi:hypothetical protein
MHQCEDFAAFVETNLSVSASARKLKQHLCDFDARTRSVPSDSPRLLVAGLRHTLLCGLSGKQRFGIPNPTPRVIGLFDLSGEKSLFVSESTHILHAAVKGFSPRCDHERHLREIETLVQWADDNKMGLLCVAMLPWQAGVGWAAFEIRTFVIRQEGQTQTVQDGHRFVCNHLLGVRDGASTFNVHAGRFDTKEVRALADEVCAVSVDRLETDELPAEKSIVVLQETARRLVTERQQMREEYARYKHNEDDRVLKAVAQKEAIALQRHVQATRVRDECEGKVKSAEERLAQALSQATVSKEAHLAETRINAELSLNLRECEEKMTRDKDAAAQAAQSFNRTITQLKSKLKKATDASSEKVDNLLNDANRRLRHTQDEYHSLSVSSKARIYDQRITIQKLTEIIDRKETEFAAQSETLKAAQQSANKQATVYKEVVQREQELMRKLNTCESALHKTTCLLKSTNIIAETARKELEDKKQEVYTIPPSTGPTSNSRSMGIQVQTSTVGCGTTTVASTQTENNTEPNEPLGTAEVAKAAHLALNRLIECAHSPRSPYVPAFYGHQRNARFWPQVP